MGCPGGSEVKASACNVGDPGLIPGSGRSPGEGNGNPLQYSCLGNPMDRGAWWATVHGVAKSRTQLSDFTFAFKGQIAVLGMFSDSGCFPTCVGLLLLLLFGEEARRIQPVWGVGRASWSIIHNLVWHGALLVALWVAWTKRFFVFDFEEQFLNERIKLT